MWCPRCHTEVAAEIAQNGQSLNCTSCGTEIQRIYAPSLHPDTRSARELLERWSKGDLLEGVPGAAAEATPPLAAPATETPREATSPLREMAASSPPPPSATDSSDEGAGAEAAHSRRDRPERTKPERPTPKSRTTWRVDAAHTVTQPAAPLPPPVPPKRPHFSTVVGDAATGAGSPPKAPIPAAPTTTTPAVERVVEPLQATNFEPAEDARREEPAAPESAARPVAPQRPPVASAVQHRLDPPHAALGGPHFDLQTFLTQDARKPGRSESIWGQVLAYAGVGLITVGTTLVLWAWFSKSPQYANYAPTGWLVCTVGQMLLFLGVTTLISGGMQQTSHEVTRRVEYLGDRILRFEQSADQLLRGPHFNEIRDQAKARAGASHSADEGEHPAG